MQTSTRNKIQPKFIVRFPSEEMRQRIDTAANRVHISMNAFVLQAIDEKLARETPQQNSN